MSFFGIESPLDSDSGWSLGTSKPKSQLGTHSMLRPLRDAANFILHVYIWLILQVSHTSYFCCFLLPQCPSILLVYWWKIVPKRYLRGCISSPGLKAGRGKGLQRMRSREAVGIPQNSMVLVHYCWLLAWSAIVQLLRPLQKALRAFNAVIFHPKGV